MHDNSETELNINTTASQNPLIDYVPCSHNHVRNINTQQMFTERMEKWPTKTSVLCWWCCHSFDNCPVGLPESMDKQKRHFIVRGNFCSFSCAKSYLYKSNMYCDYKVNIVLALLKQLFVCVTGKTFTKHSIISAPPKETLRAFGGTLTIEEFRSTIHLVSSEIIYTPMIADAVLIQQTRINKSKELVNGGGNNEAMQESSSVNDITNKPFRLMRTKPVVSANNTQSTKPTMLGFLK